MSTTLTKEQQQVLTLRDQYAQQGVNYDKATRRFLEEHSDERPTDQLKDLVILAINNGLYDAADWLQEQLNRKPK
jgi:lipopolysaccharide biosynthesis regulator YciM